MSLHWIKVLKLASNSTASRLRPLVDIVSHEVIFLKNSILNFKPPSPSLSSGSLTITNLLFIQAKSSALGAPALYLPVRKVELAVLQ